MNIDNMFQRYPEVLDARMISEILRISYIKALHMIKYSGISYLKIGNTYRVSRATLSAWIEESGQRCVLS